MSRVKLGLLAATSLALLVFALADPWQSVPRSVGSTLLPSGVEDSVTALRIEADDVVYELSRDDEGWQIVAPLPAPASAAAVQKLTEALRLLRSMRSAPGERAGETGLRVTLDSAQGSFSLAIGEATSDRQQRWVRMGPGKRAQLVEEHLVEEIEAIDDALVSRKLLPFTPSRTQTLRLQAADLWLELADGAILAPGFATPMPMNSKGEDVIDTLRALRFDSVALEAEACATARSLRVAQEGREQSLEECGPCAGGGVQVQVGHRRGCVAQEPWRALFAAVENPLSGVRLALLPAQPELFSLRCGDRELQVDPAQVDAERLGQWWSEVNASVVRIVPARAGQARCRMDVAGQEIVFSRSGTTTWLAGTAGSSYVRELDGKIGSLLDIDALRFASLALIVEDAIYARRMELRRRGWREAVVIEREDMNGPWHEASGRWSRDTTRAVAEVLRTELAMVRAKGFVDTDTPGLARPDLEIAIDFDAALGDKVHSYLVQLELKDCRAAIDRGPVAILDARVCAAIAAGVPRQSR